MRPAASLRRLGANRPLAGLVLANGLSAVGDWLYLTALPVLVYQETGELALVGIVGAGRLLPWFLLSLPAGIVADRLPRGRILVVTESARATLMLLMTAAVLVGAPFGIVLVLALGAVIAGTFAMPAQSGLVPELARDGEELGVGNALASGLDNIACIAGPAIAGILIAVGGLELAFAINAMSFLAVVVVLIALARIGSPVFGRRVPEAKSAAGAAIAPATWSAIGRAAARPLALDGAISFASGALSVLPVLVAVELLGDGVGIVGVLSAVAGIGGIAGAAVAAALVNGRLALGIAAGVGAIAVSLTASVVAAPFVIAAIGVASASVVLLDTLNTTVLQRVTPPDRLGRTFGLLNTLASLWVMAGCLVPPVLATTLGIPVAVLAPAIVVAVLGGVSMLPAPRRIERTVLAAVGSPSA